MISSRFILFDSSPCLSLWSQWRRSWWMFLTVCIWLSLLSFNFSSSVHRYQLNRFMMKSFLVPSIRSRCSQYQTRRQILLKKSLFSSSSSSSSSIISVNFARNRKRSSSLDDNNDKEKKDNMKNKPSTPLSSECEGSSLLLSSTPFEPSEIIPVQLTSSVYHHTINYESLCEPHFYGSVEGGKKYEKEKNNGREFDVSDQSNRGKYTTKLKGGKENNRLISLSCALGECERQGKVIVFFPSKDNEKTSLKGDDNRYRKDQNVLLPSNLIVPYPSSLSTLLNPEQILHLPLYALLFVPPLIHKGGLPSSVLKAHSKEKRSDETLMRSEVSEKSIDEYIVIVTGSSLYAQFIIDLLIGLGIRSVISVSRNENVLRSKLGVSRVIDFSKESFSDEVPEYDLVIDTIADGNRDGSGMNFNDLLSQVRNSRYVPLVPQGNQNAQEKGIFSQVSKLTSVFFGGSDSTSSESSNSCFTPNSRFFLILLNLIQKIDKASNRMEFQKSIEPFETESYFHTQDYTDSLFWPKDSETGIRYGFPSYSSSSSSSSVDSDEESDPI